jgi:hypothetical protein
MFCRSTSKGDIIDKDDVAKLSWLCIAPNEDDDDDDDDDDTKDGLTKSLPLRNADLDLCWFDVAGSCDEVDDVVDVGDGMGLVCPPVRRFPRTIMKTREKVTSVLRDDFVLVFQTKFLLSAKNVP